MRATVIIPCKDEEACIGTVVDEVRRHFPGPIIVVDNGSGDRTADVAREAGATVIAEPRPGYGRACMAGVRAASEAGALVFMDGDGSDDPVDIPTLLAAIEQGADLALGVRRGARVEPGSIAPAARFGNWLSGTLIGLRWGRRIPDLSPLKAVRAKSLADLELVEETYGWTVELLAKSAARGLAIAEVETGYRHRAGGTSKVSGSLRGSLRAGTRILAVLSRVMIRGVSIVQAGVGGGLALGMLALFAYSAWLVEQAPSSRAILVSSLLLAWPTLLAGALFGGAAGAAIQATRRRG